MAQAAVNDSAVVRRAGVNPWKPIPADPAAYFSPDEIAKAKEYVTPMRRLARIENGIGIAALLLVAGLHLVPKLHDDPGAWVGRLIVAMVVLQLVDLVTGTPFAAYRELVYDKRWGFSTQTTKGFVTDLVKSLLLGTAINVLLFLPLWWVIRHTDLWWVYGWILMAFLAVGIGLLGPVLIMPIFNKFTPLDDEELRDDLLGLARGMNADVDKIEVSDASRRTRKDNAFVAGAGKTRKLVLFDTLLQRPKEQIRCVAAHEIGHWKLKHVTRRMVPLVTALLFVNFAVLRLALSWDPLLRFAGVEDTGGVKDPAILPLFMLLFPLASTVTGLISSYVSRASEREADIFALETTSDPESASAMIRSLHTDNLADLAPSWWKRVNASHPPAAERLALVDAWRRGSTA